MKAPNILFSNDIKAFQLVIITLLLSSVFYLQTPQAESLPFDLLWSWQEQEATTYCVVSVSGVSHEIMTENQNKPFSLTHSAQPIEAYIFDMEAGDMDGDQDLDVWIVGDRGSSIWLNDGNGIFIQSDQLFETQKQTYIQVADLDSDGDLDAVIVGETANLIYTNDGKGRFRRARQRLGKSDSRDIALFDIDLDGDLDAWIPYDKEPDQIWINDGVGNFSDSGQRYNREHGREICVADFNGDNLLDVVGFNRSMQIWLNQGQGSYEPMTPLEYSGSSIMVGDLDGDKDQDIWIQWKVRGAHFSNGILINDGHGNFNFDIIEYLGSGIALHDFNSDGFLDVLWTFWNGGNRILINDGQNGFKQTIPLVSDLRLNRSLIQDFDNDGNPDAWLTYSPYSPPQVWLSSIKPNMSLRCENEGALQLEFQGTLFQSVSPKGPFEEMQGATSPMEIFTQENQMFFHVR